MGSDNPPPYALVGPGNHHDVLLSTVNDFPGYEVKQIYGLVYGTYVTNSSRGFNGRKQVDREFVRVREQVVLAREKAAERLIDGIISSGGNAACGMRFDISYLAPAGMVEVTCYGTAALIVPHQVGKA